MSNYILFFISAYSILIACSTFLIVVWYLLSFKKKEVLKEIVDAFSSSTGLSAFISDEPGDEVASQIDSRLDDIVTGFKKQIPMIGMFLSKTKEAELKETARVELMKLIPSIKQHFSKKTESILTEGALAGKVGRVVDGLWRQVKCRLMLVVVLVGLVLGLVEVGLLMLLNR